MIKTNTCHVHLLSLPFECELHAVVFNEFAMMTLFRMKHIFIPNCQLKTSGGLNHFFIFVLGPACGQLDQTANCKFLSQL